MMKGTDLLKIKFSEAPDQAVSSLSPRRVHPLATALVLALGIGATSPAAWAQAAAGKGAAPTKATLERVSTVEGITE